MPISYHEEEGQLSEAAKDIHRALSSLHEEIEAIDWYGQRIDVSRDAELKALLLHNRDEEIEHAAMLLEYLRRKVNAFDPILRTYLFTEADIVQVEQAAMAASDGQGDSPSSTIPGDLNIRKM